MQLFFPGGGKHGRLCPTPQLHNAPRVVTGARKCLMALRELKRHLLYTLIFFFCHCSLFRRLELVLATLPLKLFSRGCFGRGRQTCVCSLRWLQERGIGGMCILVSLDRREAFLLKDLDILYAQRRDCRTTCDRVNKCAVALMIRSRLLNRVCIQERSRAACHCSGIG